MNLIIDYIKNNKPKMVFLGLLVVTFFILLLSNQTIDINKLEGKNSLNVEKTTQTDSEVKSNNITSNEVHIFFHPQCPHCHEEFKFFDEIKIEEKFPNLKFIRHDITSSGQATLLQFYGKSFGLDMRFLGTPFLVFGDKYIMGFGTPETTGQEILSLLSPESQKETAPSKVSFKEEKSNEKLAEKVTLPVFGEVSLVDTSLPLLSVIIGFVDGFNPCAMWVLIFLISIVMEMKDRTKIYTLVGTFLIAEATLYFFFMTAWLNLFLFIGYVKAITLAIGLVAIYFGTTSLYDLIKNKGHAECFVDFKTQQKTRSKIQALVNAPVTIASILGMIVLAFAVNSLEFVCSSALPAIFTQVLTLAKLDTFSYYVYMLIYLLFYMIDDFIIFGLAALAINKFSGDKYGDYSKMIGGVILLILGIFMTFFPDMLR